MTGAEMRGNEEADKVRALLASKAPLMCHVARRNGHSFVDDFEKDFADYVGVKYAHAVSSGTAALYIALKAMGIGKGDTVITTCHTFIATVEAILMTGAKAVCIDVDKTLNMSPDSLEAYLRWSGLADAVLPVHIGGVPCDMDPILEICDDYALRILEDAAQSLGSKYDGEYVGTIGDAGIFSFDDNKTISTGEGGMIVTNDREIDYLARQFSDHGHNTGDYLKGGYTRGEEIALRPGFNFRMSEIGGAIGIEQLKKWRAYGSEVQRLNKEWQKMKLSTLNLDFREIPEKATDSCETIIYFARNREVALDLAKDYRMGEVFTRNLPDAIRWCYAGYWDHIFPNVKPNSFPVANDYLHRAVCLPVLLKDVEP